MLIRSVQVSWVVAVMLLLLAFTPAATVQAGPDAQGSSTQPAGGSRAVRPHLAVAGFQSDQGVDPRDVWLATALEETLAWRLRRVPALLVVPTLRVHQARRELQDDPKTPPSWLRVAAALGADLMLTGHCRGTPDAVTLEIKLVEVGRNPRVRAETSLPAARMFAVLDAATHWTLEQLDAGELAPVASDLRVRREETKRLIFAPPARSPSALEYHARALRAARAERLGDAHYYATQALDYDAGYRPALATLAKLELQRGGAGFTAAGGRLRALNDLARLHGDALDRAAAELGQGVLLQVSGSFDAAYTRFETSLATCCELEDPYGQIAAINSICDLYLTRRLPPGAELSDTHRQRCRRQNLRWAVQWQEVGLELLRELGDAAAESPVANKLALSYERLNENERALAMHQRSLAAAQRAGSRRNEATAWLYIGQLYQRAGRYAEALDATNRCLESAATAMKPIARLALAGIYQSMDQPVKALEQFERAYEGIRGGDDLANQLICARQIAELRMQLGRRDAALTALQEALDLAHALELPEEAAMQKTLKEWKSGGP